MACADKPNGWLGILLGTRLWYGFFGKTLETDKAFEAKMTEMMREVDQNLGKLGMTAPTQKQLASANCSNPKPVSAPAPEPAPAPQPAPGLEPASAPAVAPTPAPTSKRPTGLPAASAGELTVKSSEPVVGNATRNQNMNPTASSSVSSFGGTQRATHAQHKVELAAVLELQARIESMEEAGVLSAKQGETIDDMVSDFVRKQFLTEGILRQS